MKWLIAFLLVGFLASTVEAGIFQRSRERRTNRSGGCGRPAQGHQSCGELHGGCR